MLKITTVLATALVLGAASWSGTAAAAAAGRAGVSAGAGLGPNGGMSADHLSAQGRLNTNGPNAIDRDLGRDRAADRMSAEAKAKAKAKASAKTPTKTPNGGESADHISAEGKANTNGPNARTRLSGEDRAAVRPPK